MAPYLNGSATSDIIKKVSYIVRMTTIGKEKNKEAMKLMFEWFTSNSTLREAFENDTLEDVSNIYGILRDHLHTGDEIGESLSQNSQLQNPQLLYGRNTTDLFQIIMEPTIETIFEQSFEMYPLAFAFSVNQLSGKNLKKMFYDFAINKANRDPLWIDLILYDGQGKLKLYPEAPIFHFLLFVKKSLSTNERAEWNRVLETDALLIKKDSIDVRPFEICFKSLYKKWIRLSARRIDRERKEFESEQDLAQTAHDERVDVVWGRIKAEQKRVWIDEKYDDPEQWVEMGIETRDVTNYDDLVLEKFPLPPPILRPKFVFKNFFPDFARLVEDVDLNSCEDDFDEEDEKKYDIENALRNRGEKDKKVQIAEKMEVDGEKSETDEPKKEVEFEEKQWSAYSECMKCYPRVMCTILALDRCKDNMFNTLAGLKEGCKLMYGKMNGLREECCKIGGNSVSLQNFPGGITRKDSAKTRQMGESFLRWNKAEDRFTDEPDPTTTARGNLTDYEKSLRDLREDCARKGLIQPTKTHGISPTIHKKAKKKADDAKEKEVTYPASTRKDCIFSNLASGGFPYVDDLCPSSKPPTSNPKPTGKKGGTQTPTQRGGEVFVDRNLLIFSQLTEEELRLWAKTWHKADKGVWLKECYNWGLPLSFELKLCTPELLEKCMKLRLHRNFLGKWPNWSTWWDYKNTEYQQLLAEWDNVAQKIQENEELGEIESKEALKNAKENKKKVVADWQWMNERAQMRKQYERETLFYEGMLTICLMFQIYCEWKYYNKCIRDEKCMDLWNSDVKRFTDLEVKNPSFREFILMGMEIRQPQFINSSIWEGDKDKQTKLDGLSTDTPPQGKESDIGFTWTKPRMPTSRKGLKNSRGRAIPHRPLLSPAYSLIFFFDLHFGRRETMQPEYHNGVSRISFLFFK